MICDRSVDTTLPVMFVILTTTILMLTVVYCQPLKPADLREPGPPVGLRIGLEQDVGRHRRRLAAYSINTNDDNDDDDASWLWMGAAAAAAGVTSLMTMFALCTCCPPYSKRHR